MATPYIPSPDATFATWLLNFATLIAASPTTYGLIAGDATAISAVNTAFQAAYTLAINPTTRTSANIAAKDTARANAEATVRPYAVRISRNSAVDDEDKIEVGVTVPKTVPTPIPPPDVAPVLSIINQTPLAAKLAYKVTGAEGKAKPFGAIGVDIVRSIGVAWATDPVQCTFLNVATKSPFGDGYDAEDQGKKVTYFARFRNRSGTSGISAVGPWSAGLNLIVT